MATLFDKYPIPPILSKEDLLIQLNFYYALMVATEGLLHAAHMPLEDEKDHADWMYQDIVNLGGVPETCDHDAAALAGAQYYYIFHIDPRMLWGYRAALEGNPTPISTVDKLEKLYGPLPCVRYHAVHDLEHRERVFDQISGVADDWLRMQILINFERTVATISKVLNNRFQWLHTMAEVPLCHVH